MTNKNSSNVGRTLRLFSCPLHLFKQASPSTTVGDRKYGLIWFACVQSWVHHIHDERLPRGH
jgi:hypothetical protein